MRDAPESIVATTGEAANAETKKIVAEKSNKVKEQKNTDEPEFEGEPEDFD